ncbi:MAG: hypothetical protein KC464_11245 [Myxococcales bacterium]|nr:hypothetical protein [Myxococcales bacterium]MCB9508274.1 hypothetical protein [Myxococcales bacterium]
MTATRDNHRRRRGALLAGGALLALLLTRGSGWGLGSGGKRGKGRASQRRVKIRIDDTGITVDDSPATLEQAVDAASEAGAADVFATGAARQGSYDDLLRTLRDAGVRVWIVGGHRG